MRVHFRDFAVGAGQLWLYSADGQTLSPYTGTGLYGDGEFWSDIVFADSLTIEYLPDPAATEEAVPFQIVEISHIWEDAFERDEKVDLDPPTVARARVRAGERKAVKPMAGPIDVVVGTPSIAGAANDPPDTETKRVVKEIRAVERSADLQQPVPKAATPLSPGKAVTFSLGPVDKATLFTGDNSYRLEVPGGATRVTVTLETVDPALDVDLHVRFGEDNDIQDGSVVADYSSEGSTGNERIVITPQSDPPLRAGTYFVSISLFDTGVVAEGTLTAELEPDGLPRGRTLEPGQPADFRLGPVDASKLFSGDGSYRLEVPDGATRVIFTLETVDPAVDVDLYVRFGEDNVVQDGSVVADYFSEGSTGNERIVVTSRSDPPLRAGTYFVSIALFATGVEAEGTLTAEVERDGESLPPISGGSLTPGQPADFRLGPVDDPTLFAGDGSFQLEVPTDATRVIFTLESVDTDVDVDLYVRFGQDNTFESGFPVSDHFSSGLTGNERIGITRRSDPPLRAGTYFVSIRVFDTGVVADGNLTAIVETEAADPHLDVACYPEWSNSAAGVAQILIETSEGETSTCSGTLLNNSQEDRTPYFLTAAHCVDSEAEAEARSVTAFWNYQTQMCNGDLPTLQSLEQTRGASLLSTSGGGLGLMDGTGHPDGDMTLLRLEGDLPDHVVFQGWDADPQPAGTQVTGIHHPGNDDWGEFKRISFGQITADTNFGVSTDTYAIVSWHPGQGYTEPGSSGSALFSSPGTVVGALSFGDLAEEIADGPIRDAYTHFSVFYPHILQFVDPPQAQSFSIPNLGGWSTTSSGTETATGSGYGRIGVDGGSNTPSGIAIFQFRDSEGVLISEAGVPASEPVQEGRIFAEVTVARWNRAPSRSPHRCPSPSSLYGV